MKSGSMSSYRAALSGTGADIGGERDDEQPSPVNEFSPIHPHEPAIPPALDIEGRCLVCVILCERDDARREIRDLAFRVNVLESERNKLQGLLRIALEAIDGLAGQQAMPDDWYMVHRNTIAEATGLTL